MTGNQENQAHQADQADGKDAGQAVTPNQALTISPKRLAGSPACLNCGTELAGPFCYYCGQPDKNLLRFFPVLLRELLEDFLDFDSRFARTMKPLLFHPGKLTRDYLDGRRFRYTPPLRLYIFASMIFFLIAATLAGDAIFNNGDEDGPGATISFGQNGANASITHNLDAAVASGEMTQEEADKVRKALDKAAALGVDVNKPLDTDGADTEDTGSNDDDVININGKPWDRETNPFNLAWAPDFINDWINDEIEVSPQKGREIEENPDIIVDKMFDVLPIAVFIMLPLVALLLKFWYLFSGHYYVEHLIHALHNHSFLFVLFILMIVSDSVAGWVDLDVEGNVTKATQLLSFILLVWIPIYLLISLKTVYRQGWALTFAKFSLLGISYMILLVAVTSAAALAGFVLL
jgi:hypothetical protein